MATFHAGAIAAAMFALSLGAQQASAQFGVPSPTNFKERITGEFVETESAPAPEAGDQIGAFYQNQVIGRFVFEEDSGRNFEILLYGDELTTATIEGPRKGQAVEFRLYDSSANASITLDVLNNRGERFNFTFQGEEVPPLPINLPGLDLTPTRGFDLRVSTGDDGGNGGGGDDDSGIRYDVNNDGKVNNDDVVIILRLVSGGTSVVPSAQRTKADVNGDGAVTTADAIEVMRNR